MVKNFIFAKTAREITDTSDKPAVLMFKAIKDMAEHGISKCDFYIGDFDPKVVSKLQNLAIKADYDVEIDSDTLIIRW